VYHSITCVGLDVHQKSIAEPVFGRIREAQGFRRFSVRGLEGVSAEWSLVCTAHNVRKLHRADRR